MGMDYSVYNSWYQYMDNIFRQVQTISDLNSRIYNGTVTSNQSFADALESAAQKLNVPESMDAVFEEAAVRYDVPAALLKAVGKAESDFDASVVSCAGAQGVMQLMPETARALGVEDPFDARSNIMGGAKYIADKLKQYDGNVELALAAYNAGSGNVEKYGGVPPFKETQNYIRKVKEYMGMELTTGKTIVSQSGGTAQGYQNPLQTIPNDRYQGVSSEDALYYVELMKLQMQSRLTMASQSILNGSDDSLL